MPFLRFLGLGAVAPRAEHPDDRGETETVRRIVAHLETLPPEQARLLAATAYLLARAANADFEISDAETSAMERILVEQGGLGEAQAVLVTEMAKVQARSFGETEDFLVAREFREAATPAQQAAVLRACYLVTTADDSISAAESAVLNEIANELDLRREEVAAIRAEFAAKVAGRELPPE